MHIVNVNMVQGHSYGNFQHEYLLCESFITQSFQIYSTTSSSCTACSKFNVKSFLLIHKLTSEELLRGELLSGKLQQDLYFTINELYHIVGVTSRWLDHVS